ncbi:MAG: autoinducer binding domain-containing protein [Alphaproteobacteria bacterium]|nr:autoinducer binding domain-containing protein [Alphaproteobacteria bacterium]
MFNFGSESKAAPFHSVEEATAFLLNQAALSKVRHLSYWYLQYRDGAPDQVIWVATYDPAYMSLYMSKFTPLDDPVISSVMEDKFVDWSEWFEADHIAQSVDPIMARYGITRFGISMPLFAPGDDKVIFSVCTDSNLKDWPEVRNQLARKFLPFAKAFDERMRPLVLAGEEATSVFRISA